MNIDMIMKSDVLDILFENRNKNYGAYTLRKFYNKRLVTALGSMLGVVLIICSLAFIPAKKNTETVLYVMDGPETGIIKPKEEPPKPKIKEPAPAAQQAVQEAIAHIKIVKDSLQAVKPIKERNDSIAVGNTAVAGVTGTGGTVFAVGGSGTGGIGNGTDSTVIAKKEIDITQPIYNPDVQPSFPGGMNALRRFLEKNLNNPKEMEEGELVSVKVKFVVGYDGKLQKFEIIEDGGSEFNEEVIRVLKKMPDWNPGKSNGHNVAVYNIIPVKFMAAE